MLPQKIVLSIFGVLLSQGITTHALPHGEPLYSGSDRIASRDTPTRVVARSSTSYENDFGESSTSDTSDVTRRSMALNLAVGVSTIPGICDLADKIYSGIFVYVNCPEPVANLKQAFADLAKAGKQAINFEPQMDIEARADAVLAAAPPNLTQGNGKVSLRKALLSVANELQKAKFIIMDRQAAAAYRAGGKNSDVGGTPLHPKESDTPAPVPSHVPAPVPDVTVTPPTPEKKPETKQDNKFLQVPAKPADTNARPPLRGIGGLISNIL